MIPYRVGGGYPIRYEHGGVRYNCETPKRRTYQEGSESGKGVNPREYIFLRARGGPAGGLHRPDIFSRSGLGHLACCGTMAAMRNRKTAKPPSQTKPRFPFFSLVGKPTREFYRPAYHAVGSQANLWHLLGRVGGAVIRRIVRGPLQVLREGKGPMRMAVSHHRKSAPAWDAGYGATAPMNIWLRGSQALLSAAE